MYAHTFEIVQEYLLLFPNKGYLALVEEIVYFRPGLVEGRAARVCVSGLSGRRGPRGLQHHAPLLGHLASHLGALGVVA